MHCKKLLLKGNINKDVQDQFLNNFNASLKDEAIQEIKIYIVKATAKDDNGEFTVIVSVCPAKEEKEIKKQIATTYVRT